MAKVTKNILKELLKECLKEIVEEEGFAFVKEEKNIPKQHTSTPSQSPSSRNFRSVQQANQEKQNMLNEVMQEQVKTLSTALGKNQGNDIQNMFEEIFQDTAKTTLLERQVAEGQAAPSPEMEQRFDNQNDEELKKLGLQGDDVGRWAAIAFSNKTKK